MAKKKLLIICVDRDNDLYEKTKVSGPIIGKEANINAATKLLLADPEETDANTMFEAVRVYEKLSKENQVQLVTLTGDQRLGYSADREIIKQLDAVLGAFHAESCVFISDGASDEQIIPIIQSRIKIDSVRIVVMKQAKELEKTYFVLMEKLKEPHYARILFGLPGIFIIILAIISILGISWRFVLMFIGGCLVIWGFGYEEKLIHSLSSFKFSTEKISLVLYLSALLLMVISIVLGYQEFTTRVLETSESLKVAAYVTLRVLLLLPWAFLLIVFGRISDLLYEKKKYRVVKYGLYGVSILIFWALSTVASQWIIAEVYFSEFVLTIALSVVLAFASIKVFDMIRTNIANSMKLENKEVLTNLGAYVGKIIGVDRRRGVMIVQTPYGQKADFDLDKISSIEEKVVIKY
jgi:putative membrane protein